MDAAYEMANYIANVGFGTYGVDVWVDQIEPTSNGVWVESIGGKPGDYMPIDQVVLTINAKNTSALAAKSKINAIKNHVRSMYSTYTTHAEFKSIIITGDVELVNRDPEYGSVYRITLSCLVRDLSLIS